MLIGDSSSALLCMCLQHFGVVEEPDPVQRPPINSEQFPRLGHAAPAAVLARVPADMEPSETRQTAWETLLALKSGVLQATFDICSHAPSRLCALFL